MDYETKRNLGTGLKIVAGLGSIVSCAWGITPMIYLGWGAVYYGGRSLVDKAEDEEIWEKCGVRGGSVRRSVTFSEIE